MVYSDASYQASKKYRANHVKRIPLDVQISKYEEIKAAAATAGESVNGYIKRAIDERIAHDKEE